MKILKSNKHQPGHISPKEEDLVNRYYRALQTGEREIPELTGFEKQKVYGQITAGIAQQERSARIKTRVWRAAASIAIFFSLSVLGYRYRTEILNKLDPIKMQTELVAKGSSSQIILADGTQVWINAGSKLTYPNKFRGEIREVSLEGEAYFEVVHDMDKPFIIHSGNINTQVLGTAFNIKAYKADKSIKVVVLSGKVGISAGQHTVLVTANRQALYLKTNNSITTQTLANAADVIAWKNGRLVYRNTALLEVIADLQRKYDVTIHADTKILNCGIYVDLDNLPLDKALNVLAEVIADGKVSRHGNVYELTGKASN